MNGPLSLRVYERGNNESMKRIEFKLPCGITISMDEYIVYYAHINQKYAEAITLLEQV